MPLFTAALAAALWLGVSTAAAQTPPPSQPPQKPTPQTQKPSPERPAQAQGQRVTLTGCLRQASDDPKLFALVDVKPDQQSTTGQQKPGMTQPGQKPGEQAHAAHAPFYRLEDPGTPSLAKHVNKRVRITGTAMPTKDEKGADIVALTKERSIGVTTTTIRAIDLRPAPRLGVTSIQEIGDCPAPKPQP